jgi:hypothetical protein
LWVLCSLSTKVLSLPLGIRSSSSIIGRIP